MIPQTTPDETRLKQAILLTIAYADVFDYPLTAAEIHRYLTALRATPEQVARALHEQSTLVKIEQHHCLPGREAIVLLRKQRERKSAWLWQYAVRYGGYISRLPYIRMLAVTGSLAMNNVDGQADIDYLIVTEPGHLWLCRAMVHLIRRLAALEGVNLCPNYLITTRALHFPDQNLYAAHELTQMIPLSGMEIYHEIRRQNTWVAEYLPNAGRLPDLPNAVVLKETKSRLRPVLEMLLSSRPAARLEQWEMQRKIRLLGREQNDSPESCFSADFCKGHANQHGALTNEAFHERLQSLPVEAI
jgi:predicted nucleotidyltransferase